MKLKPIARLIALLAAPSLMLAHAGAALAQAYPVKPQRLIAMGVGFPETTARAIGNEIAEMTKQAVIVEPKPGANGILAAEYVAKSTPDGYTILIGTNSTHAANQSLYKSLPYDYVKDFVPISGVSQGVIMAVVNSQSPVKTVAELTALARKEPGKLTFGHGSSSSQAAVEYYKLLTGVSLTNVPYKTVPQATTDLVAGRVDFMMVNLGVALPHVKSGKLRALAVSGKQRWPSMPDVPTMHEAGVANYEWSFWLGAWAPAGTPRDVVTRANQLVVAALDRPRVKDYLLNSGSIPFPTTSDELMKYQMSEYEKWRRVIVAAGITAD
jgi:tripartite-type tricarboxylate transporter receptor subunit TctC